jgi:L,D-peptidoglycan transpeptidase YkuD (ErfK/YbiS/YcfS/YnhG family)
MSGTARVSADGLLRFQGATLRCSLGVGGISVAKQEGDGATPAGLLPIRRILWRADRGPRPTTTLPAEPIAPEDGWCDDPGHRDYNTRIRLPHAARHERLWRDDAVYDVIGLLGWNDVPVVRGRGSAIFLHVARPDLAPTEGCVALPEGDLRRLLAAGMTAIEILG